MIQNKHVYAICYRPEVAGNSISGENVKPADESYVRLNFEATSISNFQENQSQPFA